jgi:hypothetical protein
MQTRLTWWNYRCQKFYSSLLVTHDWGVLTLPLTKGGPKKMARDTLGAHAKPYGPPRSFLAPPKGTLSNPKHHHRGERAPLWNFLWRTCGTPVVFPSSHAFPKKDVWCLQVGSSPRQTRIHLCVSPEGTHGDFMQAELPLSPCWGGIALTNWWWKNLAILMAKL